MSDFTSKEQAIIIDGLLLKITELEKSQERLVRSIESLQIEEYLQRHFLHENKDKLSNDFKEFVAAWRAECIEHFGLDESANSIINNMLNDIQ